MYDPIKSRTNGFSDEMVRWLLGTQYDPAAPMGNVATYELSAVISASLVGLHSQVEPVIARSIGWIDKAIKEGEKFGPDPNAHLKTLYAAKGIGEWLAYSEVAEFEWDQARIFEEARWRFEQRPWPTREVISAGLDDYLAYACQGGEYDEGYQAGVEMYERWTGKTGPISLKKMLKPREFAYALCLHYTAQQDFDEDDLFKAGCKMLEANLQNVWLSGGQYIRAATWLKIVYWHRDRALTPLQTLLKAYDHMPDVQRPDFVKDE